MKGWHSQLKKESVLKESVRQVSDESLRTEDEGVKAKAGLSDLLYIRAIAARGGKNSLAVMPRSYPSWNGTIRHGETMDFKVAALARAEVGPRYCEGLQNKQDLSWGSRLAGMPSCGPTPKGLAQGAATPVCDPYPALGPSTAGRKSTRG